MKRLILQSGLIAAMIILLSISAFAENPQKGSEEKSVAKKVSLLDLPAPVRATVERLIKGGEIKKLEKEEENGKVIYEIEAKVQGKDVEYDIASDGSVLTSEEGEEKSGAQTVSLSDLPAPVRATVKRLIAGGEITKLEKEEENGKVVYDIEAKVQGKDVEYDIASDGSVLTSEESVPFDSLPAAVKAAAEKYFGSSKGLKASREVENGTIFYEVEGKKGSANIELKLTEAGQIDEEE